MGDIYIRRELPYPVGLNTGFVTGCARHVVDSITAKKRSDELNELGFLLWELSVSLISDKEIRSINYRFRSIDETTDVLSFPQHEPDEIEEIISTAVPINKLILGDIVISLEWVSREGKNDPELTRKYLARLIIHGILHLFGYDHEITKERAVMEAEEERIMVELEDFISGVVRSI